MNPLTHGYYSKLSDIFQYFLIIYTPGVSSGFLLNFSAFSVTLQPKIVMHTMPVQHTAAMATITAIPIILFPPLLFALSAPVLCICCTTANMSW